MTFGYITGGQANSEILPFGDFRASWKKACAAAGVPGKIMHDFRRTAVRSLERAGVSRSVATKMTGHKTESVYRRYAIGTDSDLKEGATKLNAVMGTTGTITGTVTQERVQCENSGITVSSLG